MSDRYTRQFGITYTELVMARVTGVHAIDKQRRLTVDVTAIDGRSAWQKVPILAAPGYSRNYRKGQVVALSFRHSASNYPVVVGHLTNGDLDPRVKNPMPDAHVNMDDHVIYHPETGAYIRFQSATSSAAGSGGDAQPVVLEIVTATGHHVKIDETAGKASITITSSSGHSTKMDDVAGTITTTTKGGHSTQMDDVAGKITTTTKAGHTVTLDDQLKQIFLKTIGSTEQLVLDKVTTEIAHIAQNIGVGDRFEDLATGQAAVVHDHLKSYSDGVDTQRLGDMVKLITTLNSVGALSNGAAALAAVQALVLSKLNVPSGSANTRIK